MIEIELMLAEDLHAANVDPTQVDQVVINLAVNARDAMPKGGKLAIRTANTLLDEQFARTRLGSKPGPYVLLSVSDTGVGMDKRALDHLFEPFFTTKGPGEGTGLGLAMAYGIVKQHGGHILCSSEPSEGTTFDIYFPALVSKEEADDLSALPLPKGGQETILLVEDEDLIRELGKRILEKAGYQVLTAVSGREALDIYNKNKGKVALVILDVIMPEMGGSQCLEELLKINPAVKVVVTTGYASDGPTTTALQAGAKAFTDKPYETRQLLQTVRDVLDGD